MPLNLFAYMNKIDLSIRPILLLVSTNSIAPCSVYKPYTTHNSSIRSDEGLTLKTSAFQSLYGGQFALSTPLINQIFVY